VVPHRLLLLHLPPRLLFILLIFLVEVIKEELILLSLSKSGRLGLGSTGDCGGTQWPIII
jgi:hypothetical protein